MLVDARAVHARSEQSFGGTDVHSPSVRWGEIFGEGNPAINIPALTMVFIALAETNQVDVRDGTTLARIPLLNVGAMTDNGGDRLALLNRKIYVANYANGTPSATQDGCK